ncbi:MULTISPECIES: hypothetical protein [Mesorhizobium]|uniref:Uncharacterized protein n=1 Tax=Mesorhizobium muleiense TaxID=1004279 RepID=A0A1G8V1J9_9HYPH|nr:MULTISPECIES: hypothetical protein [Mesorhizobium]MCF6102431.1 hypothetical protein [Mesorhizobium muleiense]RWN54535.1 MAG: hypothetical protein EOS00_28745 [Mesorhizobium sp.]TIN76290.1 MAG: hypothetical protein E5Y09_23650 [Mesorhizobium sp.]SDJ59972.1 hypothetical protein SAMN05428953_107175 [Mesorhizobium muleiense]
MGDPAILVLGAAAGALVAWLTSVFALPTALHMFGRSKGLGLPVSVEEKQMREHLIRRLYLVVSPLACGVMGAAVALQMFGGAE